jgi:hypothetical protein
MIQWKRVDQADAGEDEDRPHQDGTEDAPEEHAVLVLRVDAEILEDDDEDEDVVHAQAHLDDVAGEELERRLAGRRVRHLERDEEVEGHRQAEPDGAPREGLLQRHDVGLAVEDAEIQREHQRDKGEETGPGPPGHGAEHGEDVWHVGGQSGRAGFPGASGEWVEWRRFVSSRGPGLRKL